MVELNDILVKLRNQSCKNHFSKNLLSCFLSCDTTFLINTHFKKHEEYLSQKQMSFDISFHSSILCFINYFNVLCSCILTQLFSDKSKAIERPLTCLLYCYKYCEFKISSAVYLIHKCKLFDKILTYLPCLRCQGLVSKFYPTQRQFQFSSQLMLRQIIGKILILQPIDQAII